MGWCGQHRLPDPPRQRWACVCEPSLKSAHLGVGISRCENGSYSCHGRNSPQKQPKARCPHRMMCVSGSTTGLCVPFVSVFHRVGGVVQHLIPWMGMDNIKFHVCPVSSPSGPMFVLLHNTQCTVPCRYSVFCRRGQTRVQKYRHFAADSTATQESWLFWIVSIGSRLAECAGSCSRDALLFAGHRRWHPASPWEDEETDRMRFPCQGVTRSESRCGNARRQRGTDACLVTDSRQARKQGQTNDDTALPRSQQPDPIRRDGRPRIEVDTAWEMA